jgi:hypothetical protein
MKEKRLGLESEERWTKGKKIGLFKIKYIDKKLL